MVPTVPQDFRRHGYGRPVPAHAEITPYVAAAIGVGGVMAGVVLKAGFDWLTEGSRRRREDSIRFVTEKRAAYSAYVTALREVIAAVEALRRNETHAARTREVMAELKAAKRARRQPSPDLIAEGKALEQQMDTDEEMRVRAIDALDGGLEFQLHAATLELEFLAPRRVLTAASRVPPAFGLHDVDALRAAADDVIEEARRDLRVPD